MSWKPRLMSVEESIAWIVGSAFLVVIPACLYGYGVDLHSWKKCAELVFWVGMFAYSTWSAIKGAKRNRQERIQRETGLESGKNK